jgi:hypothetical protein
MGPKVLLAVCVSFIIAMIPGSFLGYKAYWFAWTDPRFCFTCHIHDYAIINWKKSAHGDVTTCHDCHHLGLLHYTYIGARTFIYSPKYPEDLKEPPDIPDNLCMQCHVRGTIKRENWTLTYQFDKLKKIPTIDITAGHRWHLAAKTDKPGPEVLTDNSAKEHVEKGFLPEHIIKCMRCHGADPNRPHHYRATDTNCRGCHAESHLSEQLKFAGTDCLVCHINAFVLDYRNPASRALKPEEVKGRKQNLDDLLKELKEKYPIDEMVGQ